MKDRDRLLGVMLLFSTILVGCGNQAESSPIVLPTLPPLSERTPPPLETWGKVIQTLHLDLKTSGNCAEFISGAKFMSTLEDFPAINHHITHLGIELTDEVESADVQMQIILTCNAFAHSYYEEIVPGGPQNPVPPAIPSKAPLSCYTSFAIFGDMILKTQGEQDINKEICIYRAPDERITGCANEMESITGLKDAWRGVEKQMLGYLAEEWGANFYIWPLIDTVAHNEARTDEVPRVSLYYQFETSYYGIQDLSDVPMEEIIPLLIAIIDDEHLSQFHEKSVFLFSELTKQPWSRDAQELQEWWEGNPRIPTRIPVQKTPIPEACRTDQ